MILSNSVIRAFVTLRCFRRSTINSASSLPRPYPYSSSICLTSSSVKYSVSFLVSPSASFSSFLMSGLTFSICWALSSFSSSALSLRYASTPVCGNTYVSGASAIRLKAASSAVRFLPRSSFLFIFSSFCCSSFIFEGRIFSGFPVRLLGTYPPVTSFSRASISGLLTSDTAKTLFATSLKSSTVISATGFKTLVPLPFSTASAVKAIKVSPASC